jgi:hypothetical protein
MRAFVDAFETHILDIFTRIWEYIFAAGGYWWLGLAVLLALERLAERAFHEFWKKHVDPWLNADRRRQILFLLALAAFVYGNYRAFEGERLAKEQVQKEQHIVKLDPAWLYQNGFQVASIVEPTIDIDHNMLIFPVVTASKELGADAEFEFRNWRLLCSGTPGAMMSFGAMKQISYANFKCRIEGQL